RDFIAKVELLQLSGIIEIHRVMSDYYDPPPEVGILIVDGNHGPQVLKDVQRYAPSVTLGGCLFLDDLEWQGGDGRSALKLLLDSGFKELYRIDTGMMLQRTR